MCLDGLKENVLTGFPQTAALSSRSIGSLAACQVHQTQLAHIHLAFVLQLKKQTNKKHTLPYKTACFRRFKCIAVAQKDTCRM